MPEQDARRWCLEEVQKLADDPDASPDRLMFLIKGLRKDDDPAEVKVLRQILPGTKNEELRAACLKLLAKWVLDGAEVREDVLRTLRNHLDDQSRDVRSAVVRAFGRQGDVRDVPALAPLLNDPDASVRETAARSICELLGWRRPDIPSGAEEETAWMVQFKERLDPVLQALDALQAATRDTAG